MAVSFSPSLDTLGEKSSLGCSPECGKPYVQSPVLPELAQWLVYSVVSVLTWGLQGQPGLDGTLFQIGKKMLNCSLVSID